LNQRSGIKRTNLAAQNGQAKGQNLRETNPLTMYEHFLQLSSFFRNRQNSSAPVPQKTRAAWRGPVLTEVEGALARELDKHVGPDASYGHRAKRGAIHVRRRLKQSISR